MEEKERFELFGEHCIKDNNPDARPQLLDAYVACVILNEQDKENQQLKQQLEEKDKDIKYFKESYYMIQDEKDHYAGQCLNLQDRIEELEKNNKRIRKNWENSKTQQTRLYNNLKQQLHDLPKKIVVEIREKVIGLWYFVLEEQKEYFEGNRYVLSQKDFNEILDTILKKYGDGE